MNRDSRRRSGALVGRLLVIASLAVILAPLAGGRPVAMAHATSLADTITLTPSLPSGVGAGTSITWTASSTDPNPLVYQFSVAYGHLTSWIVRDFSPKASFNWTP